MDIQNIENNLSRMSFTPSNYMRAAHPDLFSDSIVVQRPILDKSYIEYFLQSLTERKQEILFEEFCRRLLEYEVCPNLLHQTGPTGGGDSKTDSSTYPISPALSVRAYYGTPLPASDESWAFAFSTAKQWKKKVYKDFASIAELPHSFSRVYFVTNQSVRDKDRNAIEIDLKNRFGFNATIFDRTWIVERLVRNNRYQIAIEVLGMSRGVESIKQTGPIDAIREKHLEEIKAVLADSQLLSDHSLSLNYRRAAILARSLGHSREDIEGFFARAVTLAKRSEIPHLIVQTYYDQAWTCNWWFDDTAAVNEIYGSIEHFLPVLDTAEDIELFVNLHKLLLGGVYNGDISTEAANISQRWDSINQRLLEIGMQTHRPNNALYANTLLWLQRILIAFQWSLCERAKNTKHRKLLESQLPPLAFSLDDSFLNLKKCIEKGKLFAFYPMQTMANYIIKGGDIWGDGIAGYDDLIEIVGSAIKARSGEAAEGEVFLERGIQLLRSGNTNAALLWLGRARVRFTRRETLDRAIHAALVTSDAYMKLNLYWAARMESLFAAHLALRLEDGTLNDPEGGLSALQQLCVIELQLNRFGPAMAWYSLARKIIAFLVEHGHDFDELREILWSMDKGIAYKILTLDSEDVKEILSALSAFEQLRLDICRFVTIWRRDGDESAVGFLVENAGLALEEAESEVRRLREGSVEEPKWKLTGETRSWWRMGSTLWGVDFNIECRNRPGIVGIAENMLGIIEGILATVSIERIAFLAENITVSLDEGGDDGYPNVEVLWPTGRCEIAVKPLADSMNASEQYMCREWIHQCAINAILNVTVDPIDDLLEEFEKWGKEGAYERAFTLSPSWLYVSDLLRGVPYELSGFVKDSASQEI